MRRLFFIFLLAMLASPGLRSSRSGCFHRKTAEPDRCKKLHGNSVIADSDEIVDSTLKPMLMREKMHELRNKQRLSIHF